MQFLLFFGKVVNNLFRNNKGKVKYYNSWKYLHTVALQGMGNIQGLPTKVSGEDYVIRKVIAEAQNNILIVDVGANKGQYTDLILEQGFGSKPAAIHLFEPSKVNVQLLEEKFHKETRPNVSFVINGCALSDSNSTAFLYTDSDGSDLGSLYDLKIPIRPFDEEKKESIVTKTLDDYAAEHEIKKVDLLKIDVEGGEYNVLSGAKKLLEERVIKNIQFEFGPGNITAKIFFIDFWNLLSDKYNFFQVIGDGLVPVKKYSVDKEIFITVNYYLSLK